MKNYLYNLFFFRLHDNIWLKLLILFSIVYLLFFFYQKNSSTIPYEGFQQKDKFVLKTENDSVDDFYSEIYDSLHKPYRRIHREISTLIQQTMPSPEHSVFLQIGSATGHVIQELNELGFPVYGIDQSTAMVDHATKLYPHLHIKHGDVSLDSMLYEKGVFTHILCLYYSIYQIQDKKTFFENCYFWMKPGGYLILHLVEVEEFDKQMPCIRSAMFPSSTPRVHWNQDMKADFFDFKYKARYQPTEKKNEIQFIETFTDSATGNIRQNERTMYMDSMESILQLSIRCGFTVQGQYQIHEYFDKKQYMVILERTL